MTEDALYQARILALARVATGAGLLADPDARVTVDNPLCGDRITLDLAIDGTEVTAIGHKVRGCALCEAAAALIAANAVGATPAHLQTVADAADALLRSGGAAPPDWPDLEAFRPVATAKSRHRCVLLPFEALIEALSSARGDAE